MKTPKYAFVIAVALLALWLAGCTTVESRIRQNPAIFSQLTPAQQDMIKRGEIGIGFSQEMVRLALGEPDHVMVRTDANGASETWSYVSSYGYDGGFYGGWYHRYPYWGSYWGGPYIDPYFYGYPYRREHVNVRVVFKDGRAVSIEQRRQ